MNFKLKENHNYSYLYFVVIGLGILAGFIFGVKAGIGVLFGSYTLVGILQLYSGIALNNSGIARYRKDRKGENTTVFYIVVFQYLIIGAIGLLITFSLP